MTSTTTGASIEHAIGPTGLLSIRLRDGRARLRAVDGGSLGIRDRRGRDLADSFEIDLGEGSASLQAEKRHGGRHTPDVEVDVPRGATVVLEAGSADFEVDGLVGDQRYRTASGDMTLRGVAGRIAVDAVSGDVDMSATGESALAIRTVSGDVELRAATITALEATTTSGDLRIAGRLAGPGPFAVVTVSGDTLLAPAGDVRIEMATLSGDLRSKVGGRAEGGRGHRSLVVGDGGPLVTLRSLSGDLLVVPPTPVREPGRGRRVELPTRDRAVDAPGPRMQQPEADPGAEAQNAAIAAAYDEARLRVLRSLERGEIDVAEAGQRLEALDGVGQVDPSRSDAEGLSTTGDSGDRADPATETARFDTGSRTDA